jgi:uncharacterized Tic20 family protein
MDTALDTLPQSLPTEHERHWAGMAHLSALLLALLTSWAAGVAGVAAALAIWLVTRDESPFIAAHAREALNFTLSMLLYACAAGVLAVVLVGVSVLTLGIGLILTVPAGVLLVLAVAAIAVMWLVCSIIATVRAFNGEPYRYPLSLRLVG